MLTRNLGIARLQHTNSLIIELKCEILYENQRPRNNWSDKSIKNGIYIDSRFTTYNSILWHEERENENDVVTAFGRYDFSIYPFIHNVQSMTQNLFIIQFYSDHARMSIDFVDINWTKNGRRNGISFLYDLSSSLKRASLYLFRV